MLPFLLPLLPVFLFQWSELPLVFLNTLQRSLQGSCLQSSLENPARNSFQPSASYGAASAALLPSLEPMGFLVEGQSTLFFRAQMGPAAGFSPGRRAQKREESIQKENAFHNKWKSLKPRCIQCPKVSKFSCERPFHLTLEMRNRVVFL